VSIVLQKLWKPCFSFAFYKLCRTCTTRSNAHSSQMQNVTSLLVITVLWEYKAFISMTFGKKNIPSNVVTKRQTSQQTWWLNVTNLILILIKNLFQRISLQSTGFKTWHISSKTTIKFELPRPIYFTWHFENPKNAPRKEHFLAF